MAAVEVDAFGLPRQNDNADLVRERSGASFNIEELTHIIDGGEHRTNRRKELGMFIFMFYDYCYCRCLQFLIIII